MISSNLFFFLSKKMVESLYKYLYILVISSLLYQIILYAFLYNQILRQDVLILLNNIFCIFSKNGNEPEVK